MGSLKLTTASSGSVILSPANTASDVTITVPAVTGTMLTTATAGTVLQVVQGSTTTGTTVAAGSSFTATNLTASITPKFSSSKVLVLVNGAMYGSTTSAEPQGTIYRNGSNLVGSGNQLTDTFSSAGAVISSASCAYLDSPATTSSTTYTFYIKNSVAGNGTFPVNNGTATIVLMEIAA